METHDGPERREHERVALSGSAMLLADPGGKSISVSGHLIDVSRGGCQMRLQRPVDPNTRAQVRLELAGDLPWFPAITSWVRQDHDGWVVGCIFDPLSTTMQDALRKVTHELSLT
jgi:hypothetical protein